MKLIYSFIHGFWCVLRDCRHSLLTFICCFCSPSTLILFQDFGNTAFYCKIPRQTARCRLLVRGIAFSLHLFVLPQAHTLKLWGMDRHMAYYTAVLSFL